MMRTRFGRKGEGAIQSSEAPPSAAVRGDAKARAKQAFESQDYASALEWYQAAVRATNPKDGLELSVLLSNSVACRLQLMAIGPVDKSPMFRVVAADEECDAGGESRVPELVDDDVANHNHHDDGERSRHAKMAVDEARRCVRLNPTWAKGYLRLAEALLATSKSQGRHLGPHSTSNEACNCLQTALRLDPGLVQARRLLQQELRRDPELPVPRRVRFASADASAQRDGATGSSCPEHVANSDMDGADMEPLAAVSATGYELHDDESLVPRARRFRSTCIRARRKLSSLFWRNADRLCQVGMLLALVLFLGELFLLLDELAVQTPVFQSSAKSSSTSGFASRMGPFHFIRQYRRASVTFRGNYKPSHIYQHYQQALTFDKYLEAYQEFRSRSQNQLRRSPAQRKDPHAPPPVVPAPPPVRPTSSHILPPKMTPNEAGVGLVCWLLLLPIVLMSMVYMRRNLVASAVLPIRHARHIVGHYYASSLAVIGQRGGS